VEEGDNRGWGRGDKTEGGWGIMEGRGGVNASLMYLIYCENLCKYQYVPLPRTTVK
jgi:hypothetical protein